MEVTEEVGWVLGGGMWRCDGALVGPRGFEEAKALAGETVWEAH